MSTAVPTTAVELLQASSSKMHTHSYSQQAHYPKLELAIPTSRVGLYAQPPGPITSNALAQSTMSMTAPPSDIAFTRLLSGSLADFECFSRQEHSRWLIDIAHGICDPLQKRGILQVWHEAERTWTEVISTDPLIASLYAYLVPDVVALTKVSARSGRSRTGATGNPSTMANRVNDRDGRRCWVTRTVHPISNSHIIPKRMGDHLLRLTYETFVQTPPPPALSIYDEICGITLSPNLDRLYDKYEFGLWPVAPVGNPSFLIFYR